MKKMVVKVSLPILFTFMLMLHLIGCGKEEHKDISFSFELPKDFSSLTTLKEKLEFKLIENLTGKVVKSKRQEIDPGNKYFDVVLDRIPFGQYRVLITILVESNLREVHLTQVEKFITIDSSYDLLLVQPEDFIAAITKFDNDQDGYSNLREVMMGSDPDYYNSMPSNIIVVPDHTCTIKNALMVARSGDIIKVKFNNEKCTGIKGETGYADFVDINVDHLTLEAMQPWVRIKRALEGRQNKTDFRPFIRVENRQNVTIRGFHFLQGNCVDQNGAAIQLKNAENVLIENNLFSDNTAPFGGAIGLDTSSATIKHNTFYKNKASNNGTVIAQEGRGKNLVIESNVFYGNGNETTVLVPNNRNKTGLFDLLVGTIPKYNYNLFWADGMSQCSFPLTEIKIGGQNNLCEQPHFLNAKQHDFRLSSSSPGKNGGADGKDMGVISTY